MRRPSMSSLFRGTPTIAHASVLFLVSILSATLLRRFVLESNDPYKCRALIRDGHWYQDSTWLTPGCHGEGYGAQSMHACMPNRKISFIGDDSVQDLYWSMRTKLNGDTPVQPAKHDSHHFDDGLELEYLWDEAFNRSELYDYVRDFHNREASKPTLLVIGSPRLLAEHEALDEYAAKLDSLIHTFKPARSFANNGLQHFDIEDGPGDLLLFVPLQEPYAADSTSTASVYHEMNAFLKKQAYGNDLDVLWSFDRMTAGREDKYLDDHVTPHPDIVRRRVDLLVSLRCTARFSQARSFPNTRTCCGTWRHRNWFQTSFLAVGMAILPAIVLADYFGLILREQDRPVVRAMCAFTAAISLQYITDRTHIFEQVQRLQLVPANLRNMLIAALAVGVVSIRRSASPKSAVPGGRAPDQLFLPRDQTDELKGWMQLAIIIYHYNMAWTALWYWHIIRVCVAAYLFLTGFGHTVYFLRKGDYSFKRVVAVMLRTNLLPSTLAYVMRTRWLKYYYMPLSTFWFLVVYATLAIGSRYNKYRTFVIAKMAVSASLVHIFLNTPDLPETVTRLFILIFKMSFDAHEFYHHRVKIDQYIVFVGMAAAMLYIWALDALGAQTSKTSVRSMFRRYFKLLSVGTVILSGFGFTYFWYWVKTRLETQKQWTERQPYITVIPILTFLVLRNAHSSTRNFCSFAFAWLGRYSGEMYVMQNHLWLAGDQEAVLRTGLFHGDDTVPGDRWRDLALTTPLFLIGCWIIGDSTATLTTWFTKESPVKAVGADSPASEVEMGLLSDKEVPDNEALPRKSRGGWQSISRWIPLQLWPRTVRNRAVVLLFIMWGLNLTYT